MADVHKKIDTFLGDIDWLFNINGHEKSVVYAKEDVDDRLALVDYQEDYQRITVTIYPCYFKESLEYQRKTLLHELCHCLTLKSKSIAYDLVDGKFHTKENIKYENERMTSRIENILDGLLQGKLKYAKDAYEEYITKGKNEVKRHKTKP